SVNPTTGVLTWTPTEAQGPSTNVITVKVTDNGVPALSDRQSFTVVVTEANSAPVLTVPGTQIIAEFSTLVVTNPATDADLPANTLPSSPTRRSSDLSVNPTTGVLTWSPTEGQGPSTNVITVRVTDNGVPALSDSKSFTVVVTEANSAPVLTVPANQTIAELRTLEVTSTASDAYLPAKALTFRLVSGPVGVNVKPTTGVVSRLSPYTTLFRSNVITVKVTDNGVPALSDSQSFTVVVTEANSAPVLTVPEDQAIAELSTLVVTNTATDADLPANTLTFSLVSGPAGASINPTTGVLT